MHSLSRIIDHPDCRVNSLANLPLYSVMSTENITDHGFMVRVSFIPNDPILIFREEFADSRFGHVAKKGHGRVEMRNRVFTTRNGGNESLFEERRKVHVGRPLEREILSFRAVVFVDRYV